MLCSMCADLEMNLELMAVNTDPVLNTSMHRLGCSLQGVSLALVWKDAMRTFHFCIWKATACSFCRLGVNSGRNKAHGIHKTGGLSFSHVPEVFTWEF